MPSYNPIATHEIDGNQIHVYADHDASNPNTWGWGTVHLMPQTRGTSEWLFELQHSLVGSKVFQINGGQAQEYALRDAPIFPETEEEGQAYDAVSECDGYVIFDEEQAKAREDLDVLALDLFKLYTKWAEGEVYYVLNEETGDGLGGLYIDPYDRHGVAKSAEENGLVLSHSRLAECILDKAEEEIANAIDNARAKIQALHQQK